MSDTARIIAGFGFDCLARHVDLDGLDAALAAASTAADCPLVAVAVLQPDPYFDETQDDPEEEDPGLELVVGLDVASVRAGEHPLRVERRRMVELQERIEALPSAVWEPIHRLFAEPARPRAGCWVTSESSTLRALLAWGVPSPRGTGEDWNWLGPDQLRPSPEDMGVSGTHQVEATLGTSLVVTLQPEGDSGEGYHLIAARYLDGAEGPTLVGHDAVLEAFREGVSAEGWRGIAPGASLPAIVERLGVPTHASVDMPEQQTLTYHQRIQDPEVRSDHFELEATFVSYDWEPVEIVTLTIRVDGYGPGAPRFAALAEGVLAHLRSVFGPEADVVDDVDETARREWSPELGRVQLQQPESGVLVLSLLAQPR